MYRFDLMHKDLKVAELKIDGTGYLGNVYNVCSPEHLPCGTVRNGVVDRRELSLWWEQRAIPQRRSGIRGLLDFFFIEYVGVIIPRSMGLNLSDQYWIRPRGKDISWEDVNYFDNPFSEDVGDLLFGKGPAGGGKVDYSSPDIMTDGVLKKRWRIENGTRCLIKMGARFLMQESYNEVIASRIADALSIEHVPYGLTHVGRDIGSICPDMIDRDTEFITAYRVSKMMEHGGDTSSYDHYVKVCDSMGIDVVPSLDRMIVLDYLMLNRDRHAGNFGIIRDANTLEWLRPAPIFDNGTSLKHDEATHNILSSEIGRSRPFRRTFEEQLDLASSFDWIDVDALERIPGIIMEVMSEGNGWVYQDRTEALVELMGSRIEGLMQRMD